MLVRKTGHVGTCLGKYDFGNTAVDSGRVIKSIDDFLLFVQQILDVGIQFGDLSITQSAFVGVRVRAVALPMARDLRAGNRIRWPNGGRAIKDLA
jgi:hypothetical protein